MTKYRKKTLRQVEETYEESRTVCDFCQRDVAEVARKRNENSTDIEIKADFGNVWEGGEADVRDGYRIDCCTDCFLEKVIPAIESLGVAWHEYRPEDAYYVNSSYADYWVTE